MRNNLVPQAVVLTAFCYLHFSSEIRKNNNQENCLVTFVVPWAI